MKIKAIFMLMLAIVALTCCNDDDGDQKGLDTVNTDVAYISIKIQTELNTRASDEATGANESDIKSLYLITFNEQGNTTIVPGTTSYYTEISPATISPDPVKISAKAKKMLVIANPGNLLKEAITGIASPTNYASINTAIASAAMGEITDDVTKITKGFAMINSGDDKGLTAEQTISDPLIDLTGKIQKVTSKMPDAVALDAAKNNRVDVKIERLTSKIELKAKDNITTPNVGDVFTFQNWTLDAVNTTFYPYATKTILSAVHTSGTYSSNFYTEDPNFSDNTGIEYATVNKTSFAPTLPTPYEWMNKDDKTYSIENTMEADEQKYENATRIVVKGTYYPDGISSGDWFKFANKTYANLNELQTEYAKGGANLVAACEKMFKQISDYAKANSKILTGTSFASLTPEDLSKVENGGDVIKDGRNDVIRWYQDGLCYYYYEMRHDNETTTDMSFGKYGVVRNNWYSLTLNSVSGPGTPWYPDIENPGSGDPDPKDEIDETAGYLGITVTPTPWVIWNNEIDL